jgi:hypothetical protein
LTLYWWPVGEVEEPWLLLQLQQLTGVHAHAQSSIRNAASNKDGSVQEWPGVVVFRGQRHTACSTERATVAWVSQASVCWQEVYTAASLDIWQSTTALVLSRTVCASMRCRLGNLDSQQHSCQFSAAKPAGSP